MKQVILAAFVLAAFVLAALFCASPGQTATKVVGHENRAVIFFDRDGDNKYEKIELVVLGEPIRVITAEEAQAIIATFPEEVRR